MDNKAVTDYPIFDLIAERWSPRALSSKAIPADTLRSILEAARWAPSCFNVQPWSYILATQENPEEHRRMAECLVPANRLWAEKAPVLMIGVASLRFAQNGQPNPHGPHDLGLATANLTLQALTMGIMVHQMGGILADKIRETYQVPRDCKPMTGIALGYPGDLNDLPEALQEKEKAPRTRKKMDTFVFSKTWNNQAF